MLRPTKHSHPDRTVVAVAVNVLAKLKAKRVESYDALLNGCRKSTNGIEPLFLPALNLLYLLGLVEYRPKNDSIEYVADQNETF